LNRDNVALFSIERTMMDLVNIDEWGTALSYVSTVPVRYYIPVMVSGDAHLDAIGCSGHAFLRGIEPQPGCGGRRGASRSPYGPHGSD